MDVPLGVIERLDEGLERSPAGEPGLRSEELKAAGLMRCLEHRQHLAAEQPRQHRHRQQVVLRLLIQRVPSPDIPPPGTIMCTCG